MSCLKGCCATCHQGWSLTCPAGSVGATRPSPIQKGKRREGRDQLHRRGITFILLKGEGGAIFIWFLFVRIVCVCPSIHPSQNMEYLLGSSTVLGLAENTEMNISTLKTSDASGGQRCQVTKQRWI
jgi:hypothetical protein